jgi:uncharacterized DUF497 family protein
LKESIGFELTIEWDDKKNESNIRKHGISFEYAAYVFADEYYVEIYDENHSGEEERYAVIGRVERILFVVYTERKDAIRLISARIATKREEEFYYEYNKSGNKKRR